jgi:hypothetical protein
MVKKFPSCCDSNPTPPQLALSFGISDAEPLSFRFDDAGPSREFLRRRVIDLGQPEAVAIAFGAVSERA